MNILRSSFVPYTIYFSLFVSFISSSIWLRSFVQPLGIFTLGCLNVIGFHLYFSTRPGTLGFEQPLIPIVIGLIICFFLFTRTYHSQKLSENAVNDDIDSIDYIPTKSDTNCSKNSSCCNNYYVCTECCCRCRCPNSGFTCQVASTEHFVKLNGTCLCITYIVLDIFHCWAFVVKAEGYGKEDNDLWDEGGVLIFNGFVGVVLIANFMFAKVFPG